MTTLEVQRLLRHALACAALCVAGAALAHHSYAMFDLTQPALVEGSVAKLEWRNPHTFLWVYVKGADGKYEPWAFENGGVGIMERNGWHREVVKAGEKVVVQYFPLREGGKGGHFVRLVRADGSELIGDPHAPGVGAVLAKGRLEARPAP